MRLGFEMSSDVKILSSVETISAAAFRRVTRGPIFQKVALALRTTIVMTFALNSSLISFIKVSKCDHGRENLMLTNQIDVMRHVASIFSWK